MDKRELVIVKAQSEVDMLSKELEGRVATLQYTLAMTPIFLKPKMCGVP